MILGVIQKIGYEVNDLYWLWFDIGLEEDVEFVQSPFTPAAVVFVFEYNVESFEPGVVVFVLPLPTVVSPWEKADAVRDEKNIAPIIVTDKINPILKLVVLLLITITRTYRYILPLSIMQSVLKRRRSCS